VMQGSKLVSDSAVLICGNLCQFGIVSELKRGDWGWVPMFDSGEPS
jgi:hypothetical protein